MDDDVPAWGRWSLLLIIVAVALAVGELLLTPSSTGLLWR